MIHGARISIGPLVPDDFGPLFRWANDIEAARLNGPYRPSDWVSHKEWCENIGKDSSKVVFAIRRRDDIAIIGYVQLVNINSVNRSADIGIRIGDEANRGQGYGREALALALAYCWGHLNLMRVALSVFKENIRAINAYKALGFKKEGLLHHAVYVDGGFVDVVLMAKLRSARGG
jgi:RimJ/RimL family protein N-acetyltransferase